MSSIPERWRQLYDAACNPDDERYSAVTCTLIEEIAMLEAPEKPRKGACICFDEHGNEVAWIVAGHPEIVISKITGM